MSSAENTYQFASVDALQNHFSSVFGDRNGIYLPDRRDRIDLLMVGARELNQARRSGDADAADTALARVMSRIFCVANGINDLPVAQGLDVKYPDTGCAYCGNSICNCGENRAPASLDWDNGNWSASRSGRKSWSLNSWQEQLWSIYGEKNEAGGLDYVLGRLVSEIGEVIAFEHQVPHKKISEIKTEYPLELADVTAWTLAAGSLMNRDVQRATEARYGQGCLTCRRPVCGCGPEQFDKVWDILG